MASHPSHHLGGQHTKGFHFAGSKYQIGWRLSQSSNLYSRMHDDGLANYYDLIYLAVRFTRIIETSLSIRKILNSTSCLHQYHRFTHWVGRPSNNLTNRSHIKKWGPPAPKSHRYPAFWTTDFFRIDTGCSWCATFLVVSSIDDIVSPINTGAIHRYMGSFIMSLYWSHVDLYLIVGNFHRFSTVILRFSFDW